MPFKSEKQRRYLHAKEPEVAEKWEREYPKKGQRASTNKQRQQASAIRKLASNQGGGT